MVHPNLSSTTESRTNPAIHSTWIYTACLICIACTIVNASLSLYSSPSLPGKQVPLREVKPYVGLDKALSQLPNDDSNPYASATVQNFAPYIAQLDRSARKPALVPSGRMNATTAGTIFTDEREFRITTQVRLIRFYVAIRCQRVDFGSHRSAQSCNSGSETMASKNAASYSPCLQPPH